MSTNKTLEFTLKFNKGTKWEEKSTVKLWCDGRKYDPLTEGYHPVYSYKITTPEWEYDANDIHGGRNERPNLVAGARSLFAFLYACQESRKVAGRGGLDRTDNNADLFPPHVGEWAETYSEQIQERYFKIMGEDNL